MASCGGYGLWRPTLRAVSIHGGVVRRQSRHRSFLDHNNTVVFVAAPPLLVDRKQKGVAARIHVTQKSLDEVDAHKSVGDILRKSFGEDERNALVIVPDRERKQTMTVRATTVSSVMSCMVRRSTAAREHTRTTWSWDADALKAAVNGA